MRELLRTACITMIGAAVSLSGPDPVSAHIFDERPGLGTGMTVILSVFWIAVVVGIVFLVRRLMRPPNNARSGNKDSRGEKD